MADWKQIPDTDVDPDAPVTSELMYALRDNPDAIAEGAVGAPRIVDAALDAGDGTAEGANWVGKRSALMAWNSIGSYVMAAYSGIEAFPGSVVAGSTLLPANAEGDASSSSLSGTWVSCGFARLRSQLAPTKVTIWRRVT